MLKLWNKLEQIEDDKLYEELNKIDNNICKDKRTAKSLKQLKKRTKVFWFEDYAYFKVNPVKVPALDLFEGKEYFVGILYENVIGSENKNSEFDSYSCGYLVIEDSEKGKYLKYEEDNRDTWYLQNGTVSAKTSQNSIDDDKNNELPFPHLSQLISPLKEELDIQSEIEEGLFDAFLDKYMNRELAYLFFIVNQIPYQAFQTPNEWTYSLSNRYYFNGEDFHYGKLEDLSKDYILKHYSDYCEFRGDTSSHSVYNAFIRTLQKENIISEDLSTQNSRLEAIKWLGITPTNQDPVFKSLGENVEEVIKSNFEKGDNIQVILTNTERYALMQHKIAIEYDKAYHELDLDSLFKSNFEAEIIQLNGHGNFLINFKEGGRLRVNQEDIVPIENKIEYTESEINKQKEVLKIVIENYDKVEQLDKIKPAKDSKVRYEDSDDDIILGEQILLTAELCIKNPVIKLAHPEKEQIIDAKKELANIWKEVFKNDAIILEGLAKIETLYIK